MNKKITAFLSVLIILVFIGYIVYDTLKSEGPDNSTSTADDIQYPDGNWKISDELKVTEGELKAVTVKPDGTILVGGNSFISCYDNNHKQKWSIKTTAPITSLSINGNLIYASTMELILVLDNSGKIIGEWGPFEDNAIITSVSAGNSAVVFADAGNKIIVILDKQGGMKKMIGQNDGQFVIPSPYFDVAVDSAGLIYVANTGHRRVETRNSSGEIIKYFGEPGTAPEAFCGCCNPAHFIKTKSGYVTAEKGINRIKIFGESGEFIEFVSSKNDFLASVPLDLASADGKTIYAANPADSKLYIFTRK
jgi:hypothetical protein